MTVLSAAAALAVAYGLIGVAVAIVAAATRTLHLAVGTVAVGGLTVGLALSVTEITHVPAPLALLAALAVGAAVSASIAPTVLARLPEGPLWPVGIVVVAAVVDAVQARTLGTTTLRPDPLLDVGVGPTGTAVLVGLPVALALAWQLTRTRWGARVRLVGSSRLAAEHSGIRVLGTRAAALGVAGAAAVVAAALIAPIVALGTAQSAALTVRGVAAAALLGRSHPLWALGGGALLGLAEALGQRWWPQAGGELAIAAVVIGVLVARGADSTRSWGRAW